MFYCDACANLLGWPCEPFIRSRGPCEVCKYTASCSDVRSSDLPKPSDAQWEAWREKNPESSVPPRVILPARPTKGLAERADDMEAAVARFLEKKGAALTAKQQSAEYERGRSDERQYVLRFLAEIANGFDEERESPFLVQAVRTTRSLAKAILDGEHERWGET